MDAFPDFFAFEWVVAVYAATLVIAAAVSGRPGGRARAAAAGSGLLLTVLLIAGYGPLTLRLIAPHVYLLVGYWLPGLVVRGRHMDAFSLAFEAWLRRSDAAIRPRVPALPASVAWPLELAYLFCYPLVPIAFVLVWMRGDSADLSRLWLLVLSAGYVCYVTLPWLLSRPPRVVEPAPPEPGAVRTLNRLVLGQFSHSWNTFPSGHVAVSLAAAIGVWPVWPAAGAVLGVLAVGVGAGAAAGRYHYVVDVFAGLVVAALLAIVIG